MLDPLDILDDANINLDPSLSLTGSKVYLTKHGFTNSFGEPHTIDKFQKFVDQQTIHGRYAGKSTELREGGRAAIFKHKLIISGKYGESLKEIDQSDWQEINRISGINYMRKYGPNAP